MIDSRASPASRAFPPPVNDPNHSYLPGSPERAELKARLAQMAGEKVDIPIIIGGCEIRTGRVEQAVMPHDHRHVLADWHAAGRRSTCSRRSRPRAEAQREWAGWAWEDRAAVFLRAAELLTTTWRATLNAATMLGQSKTVFQAEIDAASELIDFWRFNPHYAQELLRASSRSARTPCGTSWSTGRSKASSTPSRRSTSRRSPATCRPRRR